MSAKEKKLPPERNIALRLAYLGTNYHGWQYQNNALSIQQVLQEALAKATGCQVVLSGVGRTVLPTELLWYRRRRPRPSLCGQRPYADGHSLG